MIFCAASTSRTSSGKRFGLLTARADGCSGLLDFFGGAGGERDMRTGVGKRGRAGEPDAAPRAGHERAFAVEAKRGRLGEFHVHSAACA